MSGKSILYLCDGLLRDEGCNGGYSAVFWFTYDTHEFFLVISHVSSVTSKSLPTT